VRATREVPVTVTREVPQLGPVATPVYETRREPVRLTIPNLFGCDDLSLKLWDRCKQVEVGTRVETAVVGTRTEQVPAGTRLKAGGIGKGTGVGIETRAQVRPCRSGDERHGYGGGSLPAREEDRVNRSLCHKISASTPVTPGASRPGWAGFLTVLL